MSILSPVVTGVMSPVLTGTESNTPFYRWVGAADGTRYIDLDNTITVDGYFKIELTWERKDRDTATGTGTTVLLGSDDENDGVERLLANDSNQPANPNRITFISDGTFRNFPNALDGVEQGQFIKIKLVKDENGLSLFIDGDLKGVNTGSINPFTIDKIGVRSDGLNASKGIIADLKITDYTKLPKGEYLLGDGTAYTQVNIPVQAGDVISFDYVPVNTATTQRLVGSPDFNTVFAQNSSERFIFSSGLLLESSVTIDGVNTSTDSYTFQDGERVTISAEVKATATLTTILAADDLSFPTEGTIANFKVTKLDGSTYEYLTKDSVIDNGDGTAIAPQTGDVAEYGNELWGGSWDYRFNADVTVTSGVTTITSTNGSNVTFAGGQLNVAVSEGDVVELVFETGAYLTGGASVWLRVGASQVLQLSADSSYTYRFVSPTDNPQIDFKSFGKIGNSIIINSVSTKVTTNGLIPVFNPANNLITYASNVVSYPIDEQSGTDVLAYDENGGRYSTYDGEWTPDADHERVVFNQ